MLVNQRFSLTATIFLSWIASSSAGEIVRIKWNGDYPHNNERAWSKDYELGWSKNFMNGTPQERGVIKRDGFLNAEIITPSGTAGRPPFVILMHGCAGMDKNTTRWAHEYATTFNGIGLGVLILDSFTTRSVKESCGKPDGHWARRRSEDAYSALEFLISERLSDPARVSLLGRSNGGNATIMAVEHVMAEHHRHKFMMGLALVPPCGGKITANFYAPLFIFAAGADDANPSEKCAALANHQRDAGHPTVKTTIYRTALHGYMDRAPFRQFHGWRMGYDRAAAQDTLRAVSELLQNQPQPTLRSGVDFK